MNTPPSDHIQKSVEVISGRVLLGLIGLMAFSLPIILFLVSIIIDDCDSIQSSISAYYHTGARDALVGIICALSFCLFAYKGYGDDKSYINDSVIASMAAIFALGVSFFPTSIDIYGQSSCISIFDNGIFGNIHYVSAILFFLTLAYICIFLYTKVNSNTFCFSQWHSINEKKKSVNRFYFTCGGLIIFFMVLAGIYIFLDDNNPIKVNIRQYKPIFWLETFMLWSFAAAWMRKSKFFGVYTNNELE